MKGRLGLGGISVGFFIQMMFSPVRVFLPAGTKRSQLYFPSWWMKQGSRSLAEIGFPCKKDFSLLPES